jgi:predicted amidohydrolase
VRVALLQMDLAWEDWQANHARAAKLLKRAADGGADLALLPEMFATGFSMDGAKIAQPPGGPTERWLRGLARGLGLHLIAGLAEMCDATGASSALPRNNALWVSPEGDVARYTKLHPFSFAGEHEKFAAGENVVTWTIEGVRVTPLVCYDLRFPEPFRLAADGTDLFAVVANWPERRRAHWQLLLKARAVENLCYVAGVNRVGEDGNGNRHMGDSSVTSPWGETLVSAAEIETVLLVDVDPKEVAQARAKFPVLRDRRPSVYSSSAETAAGRALKS